MKSKTSNLFVISNYSVIMTVVIFLCSLFATASPPSGYKLVWADEFNGNSVDESEWRYRLGKKASSVFSKDDVSISNGVMRINLGVREDRFGGGGLITKRTFKSGYFETRVKMDGGYGWHEAFWTWHPPVPPNKDEKEWWNVPRIEIDCFEAKAHNAANEYSFGVIQWYPIEGGISRENYQAPESLSSRFYTYGFEVSADYVAFFFEDKVINVTSLEDVKHSDFEVILSCIATHTNAKAQNGCVLFDYLRYYDISPSDYPARREYLKKYAVAPGGYVDTHRPSGTDLWIEVEKFTKLGSWKIGRDKQIKILSGRTEKKASLAEADLTASTIIKIPKAGAWRLWVRSRDVAANKQGARSFQAAVDGNKSETIFGAHGKDGYDWQDGGIFDLPAGNVVVDLIDSSQFYVRCDRMLLTSDLAYVPSGPGGKENTEHVPADGKIW